MSSENPDTRTRILQTTLNLLENGQGEKVRMADIAKQAGISRQALYLHFATRADLLIATTFYLDEIKGSDARLAASRNATSGLDRLDAYIEAWGSYIPEIYGMAKAILAMSDTDEAAAEAWAQRMQDMREGCEAAIDALQTDGELSARHTPKQASDLLWTLLSVRNWEQLTQECGWSQEEYVGSLKTTARQLFTK
ncbi:MAG: TetR/AcrR family transcriptional regulator [Alphaproteobacteria bacterium]|nr:TetR/AcrR family transcriptional regulator [Alphaproteobacteria bacterium]